MGFVNPKKNQTYLSRVSGNERRMEVIEGASSMKDTPRKKTPPQDERKKALIR